MKKMANFLSLRGETKSEFIKNRYVGANLVIEKTNNTGLVVSTVACNDTQDGDFETAIIDRGGAKPVERYKTLEQAVAGHASWLLKAIELKKVVCLSTTEWEFLGVKANEVELVPFRSEEVDEIAKRVIKPDEKESN